jgi:hypothetical protein
MSNLKLIHSSTSTVNWKHLKNIQAIPEQHTWKAQHKGSTYSSHTGHCTYTWKRTNVKVENVLGRK